MATARMNWTTRASLLVIGTLLLLGKECTALVGPKTVSRRPAKTTLLEKYTELAAPNTATAATTIGQRLLQPVLPLLLAGCLVVLPANALDGHIYNSDYADPLHPLCERHIRVAKNADASSSSFEYFGTAVGPKDDTVLRGCSPAEKREFGLRRGKFSGIIQPNGKISAGDGVHEGVWEPAGSVVAANQKYGDVDGIRWNDGNKWTVLKKDTTATVIGEFIFYSYIGFSILAGVKGLYDGIQRKRQEAE